MINNKIKIMVLIGLIVLIGTMGIAYAALSRTLTISADIEIDSSRINVFFEGSTTSTTATGGAVVLSEGTISNTSISGLSVKLAPGSSVSTSFTAINRSESLYAKLNNISPASNYIDICVTDGTDVYCIEDLFNEDPDAITALIAATGLDPTDEYFSDTMDALYETIISTFSLTIYKDGYLSPIYEQTYEDGVTMDISNCSILSPYNQNNVSASEESYTIELMISNDVPELNEGWNFVIQGFAFNFIYNQVVNG